MSVLSSAHTGMKTIILFSPLHCNILAREQSQTLNSSLRCVGSRGWWWEYTLLYSPQ